MNKQTTNKNPTLTRYLHSEKVRVGSQGDGGYIIANNNEYDLFLSAGIEDNLDFEYEFLKTHPDIKGLAFDLESQIDKPKKQKDRLTIVKKHISNINSDHFTNLIEESWDYQNIFLKMDIEGGEYNWIYHHENFSKFKQMAIEFHFPNPNLYSHYMGAIKKINKTHRLIHLHPNNCCPPITYENQNIPTVFECTFLRKTEFKEEPEIDFSPIPSELDAKNIEENEEIILTGYPYTEIKC
jgi:hypothetical protein